MATIGLPSFAGRPTLNSTGPPEPAIYTRCSRMSSSNAVKSATRCSARDDRVRVSASSRCNSSASMRNCPNSPRAPLKRQDLIALNMLDLSMPVPDAASAKVNEVVFIYSVPLLNQ